MSEFSLRIILNILIIFGPQLISAGVDSSNLPKLVPIIKAAASEVPFLDTAIKLWDFFDGTINVLRGTDDESEGDRRVTILTESVKKIDTKLDNIELTIMKRLETMPDFTEFKTRINNQDNAIMEVTEKYNEFLDLVTSGAVKRKGTRQKFYDATMINGNTIQTKLRRVHDKFYGLLSKEQDSLLFHMKTRTPLKEVMCLGTTSIQQLIYNYYQKILECEIKGYQIILYATSLNDEANPEIDMQEQISAKNQSLSRIENLIKYTKEALGSLPRQLWKCNLKNNKKGRDYVQFGPIFQKYVMHEERLVPPEVQQEIDETIFTNPSSALFEGKRYHHPGIIPQVTERVKEGYSCEGILRDCIAPISSMATNICPYNRTFTKKKERYRYVDINKDIKWGELSNDCAKSVLTPWANVNYAYNSGTGWSTHICTCLDDEFLLFRFISPEWVMADDGKVITGVKLVRWKNTLYLQIQQGTLLPDFTVNATEWKQLSILHVEAYQNDYEGVIRLSYDNKKIFMDDAETLHKNKVLTGVRFVPSSGGIVIDADYRYFNFTTGILGNFQADHYLLQEFERTERLGKPIKLGTPDMKNRKMINLTELDLPTNPKKYYENNEISRVNKEYLSLTNTRLDIDFGQTILPFVDIQPVVTDPPTPLSGVGLIRRASTESAGYLALKLITFDYTTILENTKVGQLTET